MVFNCTPNSIFGSENGKLLRQALACALDEEAMIAGGIFGLGTPPKNWGKPGTIGYNPAWEAGDYYSYNPEKAKALMAQAGYPNGFDVVFYAVDNDWSRGFMQVAQLNALAVGINMTIDWMPDTLNATKQVDLSGPANGAWDIYQISSSSPSGFQSGFHSFIADRSIRASGFNMFGVNDDYLQDLVEAANSLDWRQSDVDALHNYVVDNCFVYTPFDQSQAMSYVPGVEPYFRYYRMDPLIHASIFSSDWAYFAD